MTRTVRCRKYDEDLEGLDSPPLPGARGQDIYDHISKKAWQQWQALQTTLINEKHLSLIDKEARTYLTEQMERFFANETTDIAEHYTPGEAE